MTVPTSDPPKTVRVAAVQAEPTWLDLQTAVEKTCSIIQDAARRGVQLIAFPECWIPGYPGWIWTEPMNMARSVAYIRNSLQYDSPELEQLRTCATENAINVCLLTADGQVKIPRRKLKPTHMERTVFGECGGESLRNVTDTNVGRVGALACWEHVNSLLKYHTYYQRELFHVSAWPPTPPGADPWSMSRDGCRSLSQTYAIESSSFVLHSTTVISEKGIADTGCVDASRMKPGGGAAAIFGPDGRQLTEDLPETENGFVVADVDADKVLEIRCFLDSCGHYSRPDLLWLGVDSQAKAHVRRT